MLTECAADDYHHQLGVRTGWSETPGGRYSLEAEGVLEAAAALGTVREVKVGDAGFENVPRGRSGACGCGIEAASGNAPRGRNGAGSCGIEARSEKAPRCQSKTDRCGEAEPETAPGHQGGAFTAYADRHHATSQNKSRTETGMLGTRKGGPARSRCLRQVTTY